MAWSFPTIGEIPKRFSFFCQVLPSECNVYFQSLDKRFAVILDTQSQQYVSESHVMWASFVFSLGASDLERKHEFFSKMSEIWAQAREL